MAEQLAEIGGLLRKAREERSLTVTEVELQTKIRAKFIEALESGDLTELPSQAHARGFLRNYAQFLYLDVETLITRFNQSIGEENKAVTTLTTDFKPAVSAFTSEQFAAEAQRRDRLPTYVHPAQRKGPAAPHVSTPDEIREAQKTPLKNLVNLLRRSPEAPSESVEIENEPELRTGEKGEGRFREIVGSPRFTIAIYGITAILLVIWITITLSRLDVDAVIPTAQQSDNIDQYEQEIQPTYTLTPESGEESGETDTFIPQVYDRVVLTISVESRAWAEIIVDGETVFRGQADPGMILQYEGEESIIILTGNGAGLSVTYNGQNLGVLGEREEVVERIFTVSGPVTPTPLPTGTPTNTPIPSPTSVNP